MHAAGEHEVNDAQVRPEDASRVVDWLPQDLVGTLESRVPQVLRGLRPGPCRPVDLEFTLRDELTQRLDALRAELHPTLPLDDPEDLLHRHGPAVGPVLGEGVEDVGDG